MDIRDIQRGFTIVEVFSGTIWEAEMVKRILDNENIGSFLRHRHMKKDDYDPDKLKGGVQVMIVDADFDEARQLLKDLLMQVEEY